MLLNNPAPHGDPLAMPKANAGDSSTVPQPLQPQNYDAPAALPNPGDARALMFKTLKISGIIEAPRALVQMFGDLEAAALIWEIMESGDGAALPNEDFALRLGMRLDPFRHLRNKLERGGFLSHEVRRIENKTLPVYSINLDRIHKGLEAGETNLFVKGKHLAPSTPQISQSGRFNGFSDFSQSGLGSDPNFPKAEISQSGKFPKADALKGLSPNGSEAPQISQSGANEGFSDFSQSLRPVTRKDTSGETKSPAAIWKEIMLLNLPPGAEEVINNRVDNPEAWRETLIGWKANPKWNDANFDGQLSRYQKKLRDGDFGATSVPETSKQPAPDPEELRRRDMERQSLYGDQTQ
jgi:hypothetical protein